MTAHTATSASEAERARNRSLGVGVVDDPYPVYHRLRAAGAVQEGSLGLHLDLAAAGIETPDLAAHPGRPCFWVYGYEECEEALRDTASFSSAWFVPLLDATVGHSIISMDEPEHRRLRILLQKAFSRAEIQRWQEEFFLPIVDEHLDSIQRRGYAELLGEVCARIPIHAIIRALGLPVADRERFFELVVLMLSPLIPQSRRLEAAREVERYLAPLVAERRRAPRDDLVSILALARISEHDAGEAVSDRRPLLDEEINSFVRLLIVAGAGTTYRQLGNLLFALLSHRQQLAAVLADRSLVPRAVEESLRWEPSLAHLGRITTREVELGGVEIPAGASVNLNFAAANHDPGRWDRPDDFDLFREHRPHLAFGFGRHRCLGIHLAQMELAAALSRILERLRDLRWDPAAEAARVTGLGFRMPTALPVLFER
jgi:cytochrome P450